MIPSALGNVHLLMSFALSFFIWSLKKSRQIEFFGNKWPWVFLEVEFFGPWVFWKCPKNKPAISPIIHNTSKPPWLMPPRRQTSTQRPSKSKPNLTHGKRQIQHMYVVFICFRCWKLKLEQAYFLGIFKKLKAQKTQPLKKLKAIFCQKTQYVGIFWGFI